MKHLEFCSLIIKNFKGFRGAHHLELDRATGVWFVRGRNLTNKRMGANGVGKSTLWDALMWCLYGSTVSGLRNLDVRPWRGAKGSTRVTLIMNITSKGKLGRYVITRTTEPNTLRINHEDVDQEAVVKLIGMPQELMAHTIVLGQGRKLFFDLTAGGKLKLLTKTLRLDRWDTRSNDAKKDERRLGQKVATYQGKITGLEVGVRELEATAQRLEKARKEFDESRPRTGGRDLLKLREKVDRLANKVSGADLKYDGAMTEVLACERNIEQFVKEDAELRNKNVQRAKRLHDLQELIYNGREKLKELNTAETCPMCGQEVTKEHLKTERITLRQQLKEAEALLKKLKAKKLSGKIEVASDRLLKERADLKHFHAKADAALQERSKYSELRAAAAQTLKAAEEAADKENPHTSPLRDAKQRLREVRASLEDAKRIEGIVARKQERAKFWITGYREIKLHLLEEVLQEMELVTNGMLEETGLVDWSVKYKIAQQTKSGKLKRGLTVLVKSPESRGRVRWEAWSGGEGQRLRLVGALSLSSVLLSHAGIDTSIEVLDEPTQHLSDEGIVDLSEFLALRAKDLKRRVYYSDHRVVESMRFVGRITVKRDENGSRLVNGARF